MKEKEKKMSNEELDRRLDKLEKQAACEHDYAFYKSDIDDFNWWAWNLWFICRKCKAVIKKDTGSLSLEQRTALVALGVLHTSWAKLTEEELKEEAKDGK